MCWHKALAQQEININDEKQHAHTNDYYRIYGINYYLCRIHERTNTTYCRDKEMVGNSFSHFSTFYYSIRKYFQSTLLDTRADLEKITVEIIKHYKIAVANHSLSKTLRIDFLCKINQPIICDQNT